VGTPGVAPAIPRKVADTVVAVVPTVLEAMTTAVTKIFTNVLRKSKKFRRLISCTKQKSFYYYFYSQNSILLLLLRINYNYQKIKRKAKKYALYYPKMIVTKNILQHFETREGFKLTHDIASSSSKSRPLKRKDQQPNVSMSCNFGFFRDKETV